GAAGPVAPKGRLARAWATAVNGLGVMAAAVLVGGIWLIPGGGPGVLGVAGLGVMASAVLVAVIWLIPVAVLGVLVLLGVRALRRPRTAGGNASTAWRRHP